MGFEAHVIEDSISTDGVRLTTMQLKYPRFIHAEAKTHRIITQSGEEYEQIILTQDESLMSDPNLSRNASSSRAIPVAKMIEQVRNDPAKPVHWGKNQPGMQAREELTGDDLEMAKSAWFRAARQATNFAEEMSALGAHKQIVNRILEPFQWISVVVTATEWANFFELRDHDDAQPEILHLARNFMMPALAASTPTMRSYKDFQNEKGWHLPYVKAAERVGWSDNPRFLASLSTARCARVSYLTHDGKTPDVVKDLDLFEKLVGSRPLHASPTEHQGHPERFHTEWNKNFRGWHQHRSYVEHANGINGK